MLLCEVVLALLSAEGDEAQPLRACELFDSFNERHGDGGHRLGRGKVLATVLLKENGRCRVPNARETE